MLALLQAGRSIVVQAAAGLVVPVLTAGIVLLGAIRHWRGSSLVTSPPSAWGSPLALALAFLSGQVVTQGWPRLPPEIRLKEWLFYVALGGSALGASEALSGRTSWIRRGVVSLAAPVVLLEFQRKHWSAPAALVWTGGLAALLLASWYASAACAATRQRQACAFGWSAGSALAAGAYQFSGSASLAQLALALALGLGVLAVAGLWRHEAGFGPSAAAPFVLLHHGLVWAARFTSELTLASFVLLSLAPLAARAGSWLRPARSSRAPWLSFAGPVLLSWLAFVIELFGRDPGSAYD